MRTDREAQGNTEGPCGGEFLCYFWERQGPWGGEFLFNFGHR